MVGSNLCERRLVRLPLRGRTGVDADSAAGRYARNRALIRPEPSRFHRVPDTEPDITAVFARLLLARAKILVIRSLQRLVLAGGIIAAVVGDRPAIAKNDSDLVGHLRRRDAMATPQLGCVKL